MLNVRPKNSFRRILLLPALLCLVLTLPTSLFSQESTLDNTQGLWLDDAIWTDGTHPGISGITDDVEIYGNVVSGTGLDFTEGNLTIFDTLTIFGNLTIGDTLDLTIDPAGILIVRGDLTIGDTVDFWTSGQMVVTGEFRILGANDAGTYDNDGVLYVFDPTPLTKNFSPNYDDFTCVDPVDSCTLYDESDLLASPLAPFYLSGSYAITAGGPTTFCLGDSVNLSVTDTATTYRWFLDDVEIAGATNDSYEAKSGGDYHATFFIGSDSLVTPKVTVTVNGLPVVSITGLDPAYCEGSDQDTLVGAPLAGTFEAQPGLTLLGAGDSAVWDPATAGAYDIKYYYTDLNLCTDTATESTVVNALPAVSFV
jgi:hypothetical protein